MGNHTSERRQENILDKIPDRCLGRIPRLGVGNRILEGPSLTENAFEEYLALLTESLRWLRSANLSVCGHDYSPSLGDLAPCCSI